jgi:hypothetical protein
MRYFFATVLSILTLSTSGLATVNFNGRWVLDLKASDSPEQMLKRMGVSLLERKLAASTKLESTYHRSGELLTVTTHAPGFSRIETFPLDGRIEKKHERQTGPYTIRTAWSKDGQELISTVNFKTKNHKSAELVVARKLTNRENTLVLTQTLSIEGEPNGPSVHRIWQRNARG